ncbi:MAG: glycosyltransferase family 2 protein [Acidobacteriota bacterium]
MPQGALVPSDLPPPSTGKTGWPWILPGDDVEIPTIPIDGPRVSIVTPSYNQARYLEETLRSVLLQGITNLEYIVIDGGSKDGSKEIIRKYGPHLDHSVSEPDNGQCDAINKGFAHTTGAIMAWLNSDDVFPQGALATVLSTLEPYADRPAMVVGASVITHGPDTYEGTIDRRRPSWPEMLYDGRTFPQPSVFWTRALWEKVGPLDEDLHFGMDYDLWLRMVSQADEVIFLDDVLSYARTHDDQKAKSAKRKGASSPSQRAKAFAACRAARANGMFGWLWWARMWSRRWGQAMARRQLGHARGSVFHRVAWRAAAGLLKP